MISQDGPLIQAPFEQAEVGMFQVTEQGRLSRVSNRFCEMARRQEGQCLDVPLSALVVSQDAAVVEEMLRYLLMGQGPSLMRQFRLDMREAPALWVNCTMSAVRRPDGGLMHLFGVLKDISAVKMAEDVFRRQHALFSRISQNSPVGLVHLEPDGNLGFTNLEANRIFGLAGYDREADQAKFLAIAWHPLGDIHSSGILQPVHPEQFLVPGVYLIHLPDGRSRHVSVRASMLEKDEDLLEGAVLVVEDVSAKMRAEAERDRLNQELARAVSELERSNAQLQEEIRGHRQTEALLELSRQEAVEANEAKSHFLANMSHEIRTPMNGILGLTDLLLMSEEDPERRESLELISLSAHNLLRILNDILDYSRLEADGMSILPAPFSLRGLLRDVAGLFAPQARQKGLQFHVQDETGEMERIVGDEERIRQVLSNLLGNAVKFTERGEISLSVTLETEVSASPQVCFEPDVPANPQICFCVQDTGIGIAQADRKRLFERFRQLDNSLTKRYAGTGLGLAISRLLAERMGGSLWLDESYEGGSRFCFRLPVTPEIPPS